MKFKAFGHIAFTAGLLIVALGGSAFAGASPVPEIDAGSMASALTVLSGVVLMVTNRTRRSK